MTRTRAKIGDRLVLSPRTDEGAARVAVVVEVLGADGSPPFVVRWADGSQTVVYPSSAAYVLPEGPDADDGRST